MVCPVQSTVRNENIEKGGVHQGKQITLGLGETLRRTKVVAIPRSSELWSAQAALCTRVSITNDKRARELHELAQYLRKIPIKYQPNGE